MNLLHERPHEVARVEAFSDALMGRHTGYTGVRWDESAAP
jgi:hypothetical protein